MVDVPEHLAPKQGLTNTALRFVAIEQVNQDRVCRFEIRDDNKNPIASLDVAIPAENYGSVDAAIAAGHSRMIDMLRQWLYDVEFYRKHYGEKKTSNE